MENGSPTTDLRKTLSFKGLHNRISYGTRIANNKHKKFWWSISDGGPTMYEVIVTYRRDYSEQCVDRYSTREEAQGIATLLSLQCPEQVVRVWVRQVRQVKSAT